MEVHLAAGLDIGEPGIALQEHDQLSTLPEVMRGGPLPNHLPSVRHELGGKGGPIERCGTWHGLPPGWSTR